MQTKLRQIHFTISLFFFSLTLLSIRIISQFFNLAFKILLIQVYLRSGYSPHCFVAVVLLLLVLDGFPVLDLNDLVAGCSCVNILKFTLVGFWKSRRLLCVPPSLYCIHDKRLLLDIYVTVLVICFWCTGMGHLLGVCYTFIQSRGWSHINCVVTGWEESVCCNTYQLVQVGQFSYCEI